MAKSYNEELKKYIIEYGEYTLTLENEKEEKNNKCLICLIILNSILLIPLIISFIELLKIENVRLFTIIFGFTLMGIIVTSIILAFFGLLIPKTCFTRSSKSLLEFMGKKDIDREDYYMDQKINDLDSIYLRKSKNNTTSRKLLFASFLTNCAAYLVLIGAVITIMLFI